MTERITLNSEAIAQWHRPTVVRQVESLINRELTAEQVVDTVGWNESHMAEILDVLAHEVRRTRGEQVVFTAFGADVEPSEEFRRGVEYGTKTAKFIDMCSGLVGFAAGAFVAFLLMVLGGVA